jgi:2,3-diketo-5-methylthio-1-phosphopentane phosphatase
MLFAIDFDGTLAREDTVDALLERFASPDWRTIEDDWLAGRVSTVDCMKAQMALVKADRASLDEFFRAIELDPAFLPFYDHVSAFASVAIISDGLDHAIRVALREARLPAMPVFANKLVFQPGGVAIEYPHLDPLCSSNGVCKCAAARSLAADGGDGLVVLIGDGKSDACLAGRADFVFAKGRLLDHCLAEGIVHTPFETFADVLATVRAWPKPARPRRATHA